jgi:tetratricopeptide (TPR) repeat protein
MRYSSLILSFFLPLFVSNNTIAQELKFDKRTVECEDKWVAFEKNKEGKYAFGFIYIDAQAGLTLEYSGNFAIGSDGKYVSDKLMDSLHGSYKVRLQRNNVRVAIIPPDKINELGIASVPDWLEIYHSYSDTAQHLQRWGYYYNDFGLNEKALAYLEPGYKLDPNYKGMAVELAFAYNALEQFDKAVPVLKKAIELSPTDGYMYKELSYALLKIGNLNDAAISANKGIEMNKDVSMKVEIAYNMTYSFFLMKDKDNFTKWAKETRKWLKRGDQLGSSLDEMEKSLN